MKKIFSLIFTTVFCLNLFAADILNVVNATNNYRLYFSVIAKKTGACYPEFRCYNNSGVSGYLTLDAGNTLSFSNYLQLSSYYPNLSLSMQMHQGGPTLNNGTINSTNTIFTTLNANWSNIIYKVSHNTTGYTEGVWLGFGDFYACHNLSDSWGTYGTTQTHSFTSFSIGDERYFVVSEY
ncbi:MAG: hypothetical protein Q4B43_03230 [Bacteroidota bacterium]|nr:hypothetical protein [Bacteroidota bacterium]